MVLEEGSPSNTSILNESLYKIKTHVNVSCMADIHVMQWSETMHIRSQSDLQSGGSEDLTKHASRGSHTTLAQSIYLGQHKRNGFKKFFTKPTAHLSPRTPYFHANIRRSLGTGTHVPCYPRGPTGGRNHTPMLPKPRA